MEISGTNLPDPADIERHGHDAVEVEYAKFAHVALDDVPLENGRAAEK